MRQTSLFGSLWLPSRHWFIQNLVMAGENLLVLGLIEFVDEVVVDSDKSARRKLDDYFEMRRLKQLLRDTFDDF